MKFPYSLASVLFAALLGSAICASGGEALRFAKESLLDHRPDLAVDYAESVMADSAIPLEDRFEAQNVWVQAMLEQKKPEAVLQALSGDEDHPLLGNLPSDERPALWKAAALEQQEKRAEALQSLQTQLTKSSTNTILTLQRQIAPLFLQEGLTNKALRLYADLRDAQPESSALYSLERARIFLYTEAFRQVLDEANLVTRPIASEQEMAEARFLRAIALLKLHQKEEAQTLLHECIEDASSANHAFRGEACLIGAQLEAESGGPRVVELATLAATVSGPSKIQFQAEILACRFLFEKGSTSEATVFLNNVLQHPLAMPAFRSTFCLECAGLVPENNPEDAIALCNRILQSDPGVFDASPEMEAEAYSVRAERRLSVNSASANAAVRDFQRAAELFASIPNAILRDKALYRAASASLEADNSLQATSLLQELVQSENDLADNHPENIRPLAAALLATSLEASNPDRCESAYQDVLTHFPNAQQAVRYSLLHLADWQFRTGHYESATSNYWQAAYSSALQDDPNLRSSALINAGLAASRCYRFVDAARYFEMAQDVHESTNHVQAACLRAFSLYEWGGYENTAVDICTDVVLHHADSPWSANAALWLGIYYVNRDQFDSATNALLFVTENHPTQPSAPSALYVYLQTLLQREDSLPLAEKAVESFLERYPKDPRVPDVYLVKGTLLRRSFSFEAASLVYEHIAQMWPESEAATEAILQRGYCQFSMGSETPTRYAAAEACFRSLLDRPTPISVEQRLEVCYRIGLCQEALGQLEKAMDTLYQGVILPFREVRDASSWAQKTHDIYLESLRKAIALSEHPTLQKIDFANALRTYLPPKTERTSGVSP